MDVQQAVAQAKDEIARLFSSENLGDIGLEEVEFDDKTQVWHITIGFSRPWERQIAALRTRSYKVVSIEELDPSGQRGRVLSVKNRETTNA